MDTDLRKSFADLFKERMTTPLTANFIIAWILYNWHVIVLLAYTDSGNATTLVNIISNHCFKWWQPILWALLITALFPYINAGMFYLIENAKKIKKKCRIMIMEKTPRSIDEFKEIEIQLADRNNQIVRLQTDLNNSNQTISTKDKEFEVLNSKHSQLSTNYKEIEREYRNSGLFGKYHLPEEITSLLILRNSLLSFPSHEDVKCIYNGKESWIYCLVIEDVAFVSVYTRDNDYSFIPTINSFFRKLNGRWQ
jgi:hypothetical protein